MHKTVTLYVPELLQSIKWLAEMGAPLTIGSLTLLLSKANIESCDRFLGDASALPIGALLASANGYAKNGHYCLVSPITCHADQQTVYIVDKANLTTDEELSMMATLNAFLKQDDIVLESVGKGLWLFSMKHHVDVLMSDLTTVVGKSMGLYLPDGKDRVYWCKLLTECQMLLSQTTSIWFWGNGIDKIQLPKPYDVIYTDDVILAAKAYNACIKTFPLVQYSQHLLQDNNQILFADFRFSQAKQEGSPQEWLLVLEQFEKKCLIPLLEDLQKGTIQTLKLVFEPNKAYCIKKRYLHYFWRKNKQILTLLKETTLQ